MAALRRPLESLLASGRVQRANTLARRAPASWGYAEVAGRFVEILGAARLTIAAGLVLDAQRCAETTAWVVPSRPRPQPTGCRVVAPQRPQEASAAPFAGALRPPESSRHATILRPTDLSDSIAFPPDLAACGIDLEALLFVRPDGEEQALHAIDELLRSGAFGLVVVDGLPARAMGLAAQVRLSGAAQQCDAAFVVLRDCEDGAGAGEGAGSLASLRLMGFRRRVDGGGSEWGFQAVKDKRRGRSWSFVLGGEGVDGWR